MAKKAQDAYIMVTRELDKYESPPFQIGDFQYFFYSAINEYISNNLPDADILQKDSDDMNSFIKWNTALVQNTDDPPIYSEFALPSDYRHIWNVKSRVKWLVAWGKYAVNDEIWLYPKRRRSTREGYQENNAYQKASVKYPLYKVEGTNINIDAGVKVQLMETRLDFVFEPVEIGLTEDLATNDDIPFPNYVLLEIVKLTRRIFLENIESQRYNASLQEEVMRKE